MRILTLWITFFLFFSSVSFAGDDFPEVYLWAEVKPSVSTVSGRARIVLPKGKVVWINVKNLMLKKVYLGRKLIRPEIEKGKFRVLSTGKRQVLEVHFSATFKPDDFAEKEGFLTSKEGLLLGNWFPAPEGLSKYHMTISVPYPYKAITSTDEVQKKRKRKKKIYSFSLSAPMPAPPLIIGKYEYYWQKYGRVIISLYLKVPDPELAKDYFSRIKSILSEYESLIGKYPYKRLSLVEVSREVGYSYPTLILLGTKVIRMPYILEVSLSHEVLHQWFGCGVYPAKGNWSEGLVTYLADYRERGKKGRAVEYRKDLILSHETWCNGKDPFPLAEFVFRKDRCTQALGYGKGAFLFHMLKREVGEDTFFRGIREFFSEFKYSFADWEDLIRIYEKVSKRDLSGFFKQWLYRTGKPRLSVSKKYLVGTDEGTYRLGFTLYQEAPYFDLKVPVTIITENGKEDLLIDLKGFKAEVDIELKSKPVKVVVDQDYEIWRGLSETEFSPNLGRVMSGEGIVWIKREKWPLYKPLIHFLRKRGYKVVMDVVPKPANFRENIVYVGEIPQEVEFLFPENDKKEGFFLEVKENPTFPDKVIMSAFTSSKEDIEKVISKLEYLWRYSLLHFRDGRTLEKERAEGQKGIVKVLEAEVTGVPLKGILTLEEVAQRVSLNRVILVGEQHNRYEHHLAQLEIVKWLYEHGHKVAIGMEMFERTYQKYLDQYLAGELSEKELLRKTEYFKRWKYDWYLYRPILRYAKEKGIPVVALNMDSEIIKKVARSGIKSLSEREKSLLPEIDYSNEAYKVYLKEVFEEHRSFFEEFRKFEYFYEAQLLWDETMAETAAEWLKKNKNFQMVILVGKGHVIYGYGIPSRLKRRGITAVATLVLGGNERISAGFADYILYPEPVEEPFNARLGIWIEEVEKGLEVARIKKGSPADKAGLKEGDIIVEADGEPIKELADLKLILAFKKKGDEIRLLVLRDGKKKELKARF